MADVELDDVIVHAGNRSDLGEGVPVELEESGAASLASVARLHHAVVGEEIHDTVCVAADRELAVAPGELPNRLAIFDGAERRP